jgi:hypothetical protein
MLDEETVVAFKEIVRHILDYEREESVDQLNRCEWPRSLFANAVHMLKREKSLSKDEIYLLAKEFLSVLDENKVVISDKDRKFFSGSGSNNGRNEKKKGGGSQLSSSYNVMAGARAAQKRHDRVLKYDQ